MVARHGGAAPRLPGYGGRKPGIDLWQRRARDGIEQPHAPATGDFGDGAAMRHAQRDTIGRRAGQVQRRIGEDGSDWERHDCLAVDEMVAVDFVDGQETHQRAAREPDQQLCADDQRQPLMDAAGSDMKSLA